MTVQMGKGGERYCPKCKKAPELTEPEIEQRRKREEPKSN